MPPTLQTINDPEGVFQVACFRSPGDVNELLDVEDCDGYNIAADSSVDVTGMLARAPLPPRYLILNTAVAVDWSRIDLSALQGVQLDARNSRTFPARDVWSLRGVSLDAPPASWPDPATSTALRSLGVGGYKGTDLAWLNGFDQLRGFGVTGRRQEVSFTWDAPPTALETLRLGYLNVPSLEGLERLHNLRNLDAYLAKPNIDRHVDLSPLAGCTSLRWADVSRQGYLDNLDALRGLTNLEWFYVRRGAYDESQAEGLPLLVK